MSVVQGASMSSWNQAELLNAAETRAMQEALLCEAVLLAEDTPPKQALASRQRCLQIVLAVGGACKLFLLC